MEKKTSVGGRRSRVRRCKGCINGVLAARRYPKSQEQCQASAGVTERPTAVDKKRFQWSSMKQSVVVVVVVGWGF